MSGKTTLYTPSAAAVHGSGANFEPTDGKVALSKAGAGDSTSSIHSHGGDDDNMGVHEVRLFTCLDNCLPACVVQYIEQLCITIHNYIAPLLKREPIQMAHAEDEQVDDPDGERFKTLNAETLEAGRRLLDSPTADTPTGSENPATSEGPQQAAPVRVLVGSRYAILADNDPRIPVQVELD